MTIPKSILTTDNTKTKHGEFQDIFTGIVYMAPNTIGGRGNVCVDATKPCIKACIYETGMGAFSKLGSTVLNTSSIVTKLIWNN